MQRRIITLTLGLGFALMFVSSSAMAQYKLTNLSSNQVKQAHHDDPLLVNAWGLVHAHGSPWWVSDNLSGWSTLYDDQGNLNAGLKVLIPTAGNGPDSPTGLNGPGSPTGIVWNGSKEFQVQGWPSLFLFATLDGTISGWAPQSNFNQAILGVDTTANKNPHPAVYTGLAITNNTSANHLFAADMANNKVDMYDGNFNLVKSFTDPSLPADFAPFGVQDINGLVYVAFASASGASGGFVEVFKEDGTPALGMPKPLIHGLPLNQPWGIAVAPSSFGKLSNTLLISNNTDHGTINAFNTGNGDFVGTVRDRDGKVICIDQLWGIGFGDGAGKNGAVNQLFFTAGPSNNLAGTFGVISVRPDRDDE
ncbi:MAG: TIGR03118 family protein [Candidatus Sulfotelmatobacter sp.]